MKGWMAAAVLAAVATVAGLGLALSGTRTARAEAYARDRAAQRRAAAATRPAPAPTPTLPLKEAPTCVTGLDTFAVAVERALVPLPVGKPGTQRRVSALRQLSAEAVRAERTAELSRPAPTLPRRMGLEDGKPVEPARPACGGKGFAELR